jgi:outer membrane protein TolC
VAAPEFPPGRELTLDEAVQIGLANAPKILAAVGDYVAAQQRVAEALAPLLPQVSSQWSGFENKNVVVATAIPGAPLSPVPPRQGIRAVRFLNTTATVTASQLLMDFGQTLAARDVAKASAESFAQALELQKDVIVLTVKTSYFTLLLSKRLAGVAVQALERAELNLRSARAFFEVGIQPRVFVTRAEVDVANAQVSLIQARNAVSQAHIGLNAAMGIAINTRFEAKDLLAYQPFPVDKDTLVAEALERRPEERQAAAQLDAARAAVRQTFRNMFPVISGSGTYGVARADMNEIWTYGVMLNWSLFDGGNKIGRYQEAQAALAAAEARLRDTELSIWQNVEQAYVNMGAAEEQIGAAAKAVESAQENFELARGRFRTGIATIIDLTDAQLALTQAQQTEVQALADYRIAIAQLERAVGRRPEQASRR